MKYIATNAIKAVYPKIEPYKRDHNFEVFGLDFMIDDQYKPFLIEINTNPCLELSSPLLTRLIPAMIENALRFISLIYLKIVYRYYCSTTRKQCVASLQKTLTILW